MSVAVAERSAAPPQHALRPVISFHGVSKVYPNGTEALRDVDLAIHQGDFCFLVGPSGAGKSTLVRLLIRDEAPSTGRIFIDGQEISRMSHRKLPKLRRKFGIVFQDYKLLARRTVAQNVAFALQVTRPGQRHLREKVEEVLWIVGLEDKLDKFPDELSGGEQQRVAIARALVHRPRIFLADEPTGNLDPDTSWGIVQLLLQINHRGTTVLMATHNREVVDLVRRRVIAIDNGRVVRDEAEGQLPARRNRNPVRQVLASLWFALHSAGQNFRRNLGVSLAGVFTMGLIIFLVGGSLLFTHSVNSVLQGQEQNASHLKIYLSDNASLPAITNFESRLKHDPRVISVTFETKDQAAKQASQNPSISSALAVLGSNPLPASLNLNVRKLTDLSKFNAEAKATPIVDSTTPTDYNSDVIGKLNTVITVIEWVGAIIAIILLTISIVIIMNTIRTAVYSRRTEIEIMKLVGATDWFVRWPFILEGMIGGLLAAIFSGAVVFGAYRLFVQAAQGNLLSVPFDARYTITLLVVLLIGGVAVGALGSFLGVRRFLSA